MKRKLLFVIVSILISIIAFNFLNTVSAVQEATTASSGKVTDITDSKKIEKSGENVVTITYTKDELEKLKWSTADTGIGRDTNGWVIK